MLDDPAVLSNNKDANFFLSVINAPAFVPASRSSGGGTDEARQSAKRCVLEAVAQSSPVVWLFEAFQCRGTPLDSL